MNTQELASNIFRKGYQWPFHATRMLDFGSSLIDLAIARETRAGRRVVMDFNRNPLPVPGDLPFSLDRLDDDVRAYLGHAGFSDLKAPFPAWALAPVSVRKCCRRQGIAAALIREGIARARDAGIAALFVLGDPKYYARFGFSARAARGFDGPWSGPWFQVLPLGEAPLARGPLRYAAPFSARP